MSSGRDFDTLNTQLRGVGSDELVVMTREAWEERQKASGATSTTLSVKQLRRVLSGPLALPILGL